MFTITNCSGLDTFGLLQFCDSGLKRFLAVISSSVVGFFDFSSFVSKSVVPPPIRPMSFCLNFNPSFPPKIVWINGSKIHALYSLVQNLNIFGVSLSILG